MPGRGCVRRLRPELPGCERTNGPGEMAAEAAWATPAPVGRPPAMADEQVRNVRGLLTRPDGIGQPDLRLPMSSHRLWYSRVWDRSGTGRQAREAGDLGREPTYQELRECRSAELMLRATRLARLSDRYTPIGDCPRSIAAHTRRALGWPATGRMNGGE